MNDANDDHRDPQVSRIYARASQGEPPPALDAAILAAARAAVAPAARPATRPWWRRLQAPLALAATLVLAIALTLTVDRNPPPDATLPPATPAERPAARMEQALPDRSDTAARPAAAPASPTPTAPLATPAAAPPHRAEPAAKSEAAAPALPAAPPATVAPSSAAAEAGARPPGTPALRSLEAGPADRTANERRKATEAPSEAARAAVVPPDAEAWIAEIRALLRAGRNEEAAQRLREFRAAWPDHPLPADLRPPGQ